MERSSWFSFQFSCLSQRKIFVGGIQLWLIVSNQGNRRAVLWLSDFAKLILSRNSEEAQKMSPYNPRSWQQQLSIINLSRKHGFLSVPSSSHGGCWQNSPAQSPQHGHENNVSTSQFCMYENGKCNWCYQVPLPLLPHSLLCYFHDQSNGGGKTLETP